ncbi:hypothetical protein FNU4_64 [Fusobacterium phage vB_FnuS_FNU4]|nr:hypothetical protein FNU4_64 [Fusobacterium phage vB_FnuS_FNU4]
MLTYLFKYDIIKVPRKKGGDKMKFQFIIVIGSWTLTITITKKKK